MRLLKFALLVLLVSIISIPAHALDSLNVAMSDIMRDFIDQGWDVELNENYIFLATGTTGLKILDRSNTDEIHCIGESLRKLTERPRGDFWLDKVRYHNGYLYGLYFDGSVDFSNYNLVIFDISDPTNPTELGSIFVHDLSTDLCFKDDLVFVSSTHYHPVTQQYGITVVDVSDPENPVEAGFVNTGGRMQNSVDVSGNTLFYSSFGYTPLVVGAVDISDLSNTTEISTWESPAADPYFGDILIDETNLYLLDYEFGLRVLDITNPAQMALIGSLELNCSYPSTIFGTLYLSGNQLEYVKIKRMTNVFGETGIIDVSDPTGPTLEGTYTVYEQIYGTGSFDGEFCFFGTDEHFTPEKVHRVDMTTMNNPVHTEYPVCNSPWAIESKDDVVYAGTSHGDVIIIDVEYPSNISMTGMLEDYTSHHVKDMKISHNRLYIPFDYSMNSGVHVYDVTNPLEPSHLSAITHQDMIIGPLRLDVDEDYLITACGYDGVWLFDVSGTTPQYCCNWNLNETIPIYNVKNVVLNDTHAYAVVNDQVHILEITDTGDLNDLGTCCISGTIASIDLSPNGNYLMTCEGEAGAKLYDVSNPTSPTFVTSLGDDIEIAVNAIFDGNRIYVSDFGQIGLHMYDVSDPQNPERDGYHQTLGTYPWSITTIPNGLAISNPGSIEFYQIMSNSVREKQSLLPGDFQISSIYPNPFNPSTTIKINSVKEINVSIDVYNVLGKHVSSLFQGDLSRGNNVFLFNGSELPSGEYFIQVKGENAGVIIKRMTLLK